MTEVIGFSSDSIGGLADYINETLRAFGEQVTVINISYSFRPGLSSGHIALMVYKYNK